MLINANTVLRKADSDKNRRTVLGKSSVHTRVKPVPRAAAAYGRQLKRGVLLTRVLKCFLFEFSSSWEYQVATMATHKSKKKLRLMTKNIRFDDAVASRNSVSHNI